MSGTVSCRPQSGRRPNEYKRNKSDAWAHFTLRAARTLGRKAAVSPQSVTQTSWNTLGPSSTEVLVWHLKKLSSSPVSQFTVFTLKTLNCRSGGDNLSLLNGRLQLFILVKYNLASPTTTSSGGSNLHTCHLLSCVTVTTSPVRCLHQLQKSHLPHTW